MSQKEGLFIIITGPTGVGKSSVAQALMRRNADIHKAISMTTRPLREEEKDGVDYLFTSKQSFEEMIDRGEFAEYSLQFNTDYYGIPRNQLEKMSREGKDAILELDMPGAKKLKRNFPRALCICILPPSLNAMEERLRAKYVDEELEKKQMRLTCDRMGDMMNFQYIVVNDDVETCAKNIDSIISAEHFRSIYHEKLLDGLQQQCDLYTSDK